MAKGKNKAAKTRGRPQKPRSQNAWGHLRRRGYWPPKTASTEKQLSTIIRKSGTLPPYLAALAKDLPYLCTHKYSQTVALKAGAEPKAFEVLGSPGEDSVRQIVTEITGMKIYAPEPGDAPWILKTNGSCDEHPDCHHTLKGIFSLVICISTDKPYQMAISRNVLDDATQFRYVELTNFAYILFPACMRHKCIADESNQRVILNALVKP